VNVKETETKKKSKKSKSKPKKKTAPFKRFGKEEIIARNLVKSSVRRGIRLNLATQFSCLNDSQLEDILPNKCKMVILKCTNNIQMILNDDVPLFYNIRGGPFFPSLRLLHQFPHLLPSWQVDTGAIQFVMDGANIMCPGFTSEGGTKDATRSVKTVKLAAGEPVAIYAQDKGSALAIGLVMMSSGDIVTRNKGVAVENIHYLGDELWCRQTVA